MRGRGAHVADQERGDEQDRRGNMGRGHAQAHKQVPLNGQKNRSGTAAILPVTARCLQTPDLFCLRWGPTFYCVPGPHLRHLCLRGFAARRCYWRLSAHHALFTRGGAPPPPPGLAALRLALALSRPDSLLGAETPRLVRAGTHVPSRQQRRFWRQYAAVTGWMSPVAIAAKPRRHRCRGRGPCVHSAESRACRGRAAGVGREGTGAGVGPRHKVKMSSCSLILTPVGDRGILSPNTILATHLAWASQPSPCSPGLRPTHARRMPRPE